MNKKFLILFFLILNLIAPSLSYAIAHSPGSNTNPPEILTISALNLGGVEKGNGGSSLVCGNKTLFFDLVESWHLYNFRYDPLFENSKTLNEAIEILKIKVSNFSPAFANYILTSIEVFFDTAVTIDNSLNTNPFYDHTSELESYFREDFNTFYENYPILLLSVLQCKLKRVGLNFYSPYYSPTIYYDEQIFLKFSPFHQLAFILHEVFIQSNPDIFNKAEIRRLVSILFLRYPPFFSEEQFLTELQRINFSSFNDWQKKQQ